MRTPRTSPEALHQLREKYAEMLSMRIDHDSGAEDGARARRRMTRLASRFPGALRELDDLELDTIRVRIALLESAALGKGAIEEWMEALAVFHALARGALYAKRWLGRKKRVDARTESAYEREAATSEFAVDALRWSRQLARIASPPRGRVLDLVFAQVALDLGTTDQHVRTLVFGPGRRRGEAARR